MLCSCACRQIVLFRLAAETCTAALPVSYCARLGRRAVQLNDGAIIVTQRWVDRVVVGHNLCPFARRELEADSVRYVVCEGREQADVLSALSAEFTRLNNEPAIETTLLILPNALADFMVFNELLGDCEELLTAMQLNGIYQIASFHPHYQFAGTAPADAENYSNRSPYPMLHILREDSVSRAVDSYPDIDAVPARNIELLRRLGREELHRQWLSSFDA